EHADGLAPALGFVCAQHVRHAAEYFGAPSDFALVEAGEHALLEELGHHVLEPLEIQVIARLGRDARDARSGQEESSHPRPIGIAAFGETNDVVEASDDAIQLISNAHVISQCIYLIRTAAGIVNLWNDVYDSVAGGNARCIEAFSFMCPAK